MDNNTKFTWSESFAFCSAPKDEVERSWQNRFIMEVESESTRGSVLTIVSFIDELLIKLLSSYFPNKEHAGKLLGDLDGCLSSLMHRANIAFSLSLLRESEFKAIKILARIRNEFAHKWDGAMFENDAMSKLIKSFPSIYFIKIEGSNKAKFNRVASNIVQELLDRSDYATRLCKLLPSQYRSILDLSAEERIKIIEKERGISRSE